MANERARQRKAEKKRLKREERRRAVRTEVLVSLTSELPPMSLTLQQFAEPLLDKLPEGSRVEQWKLILGFAAIVWNAVQAGDTLRDDEIDVARRAYGAVGWDEAAVEDDARMLRERKAARFSRERRKIVTVEVAPTETGVRVYAASALF
jgi:hypothetical protein